LCAVPTRTKLCAFFPAVAASFDYLPRAKAETFRDLRLWKLSVTNGCQCGDYLCFVSLGNTGNRGSCICTMEEAAIAMEEAF